MEEKKARKSLRRLPKSIKSLLGFKTYLTPNWIDSVCHIIKNLPSSPENHVSVSRLFDDLALLNQNLIQLSLQRRQALNDFLDLKGNIRVFCRVRPLLDDEKYFGLNSIISSDSSNLLLRISETKSKRYTFDRIFPSQSTQEEVFSEIEPVINSAFDGYNVCIFAYGQTGTGKTFTMEGDQVSPGVVPRAIKALFRRALESNLEHMFTFSMLEIYLGRLRDLLVPRNRNTRGDTLPCISIQMDSNGDVDIEKLTSIKVSDFNQVEKLYKLGTQLRSTASTMSNSTSSRSHCLTRITITCIGENARRRETSKIWMVDLGGSERLLKTQASGRRLQEGKAINLSLSALGDVISALQSKKQHVPYRNSKLTQVLRDSLGTDSKTLMLVHVSPKEEDLCETVCSLGFAMRVKSVHLGCDEPADARAKREESMAELQEKLKYYESKCRIVQRDIDMIKEKLRCLDRNTETLCISSDTVQFDVVINNAENVKDSITNTKSKPGFMRPTFSSQRKMGMNYHKPPLNSKRKSSSVYAESANGFQSENGSVYSNVTISDQSASECEIKKVILQDNLKSIKGSRTSSSCGSSDVNMANWLDLQMTKKTSVTATRTKRVLAIRFDDEQNSSMIQTENTKDSPKLSSSNASIAAVKSIINKDELNGIEQTEQDRNNGTQRLLPKIIQRLWASVLLGLGIQSLGYEHDFFNALMF